MRSPDKGVGREGKTCEAVRVPHQGHWGGADKLGPSRKIRHQDDEKAKLEEFRFTMI